MKSKASLMMWVWVIGLALTAHGQNPNLAYRPYPILLVHGFNSSIKGTWEWPTEKGTDKTKKQYSTNVTGLQADAHILGDFHFGPELVALYSPPSITQNPLQKRYSSHTLRPVWDPDLIGTSDQNDGSLYPCFRPGNTAQDCPNQWDDLSATQYAKRYAPSEDVEDQLGNNHAYVESYTPYFYNESDDADGVAYKTFKVEGPSAPQGASSYDISFGGQTQLLRIRMIQVLNEYYGDWKWVGDSTAKIKIICHSNGGIITTAALKDDERYWAEGAGSVIGNGDGGYNWMPDALITGKGFRLRDHVDQVITIDTPYSGSILATKKRATDRDLSTDFGPDFNGVIFYLPIWNCCRPNTV